MASVIEECTMATDRPINDFLIINAQWRPWFAMWKCRDHRWWAQQDIPLLEELLPGENGLVAPVQGFQLLSKGGRLFLLFRSITHTLLVHAARFSTHPGLACSVR